MNVNNIALPYPVLSKRDDISPSLGEDCLRAEVSQTESDFCFKIELKQDNEDILRLIQDGDAEYTCEVECSRTFYRNCIKSKEPRFDIRIHRNEVCREINFSCLVVAKHTIKGYANQGFHPDYAGNRFDMEPGDLLVAFPNFSYNTDIRYDSLHNAGAFMQFRENGDKTEKLTRYDITGDIIDIVLPSDLYQAYVESFPRDNKNFASILHSSLVCNALSYALFRITDYPDTRWARSIRYRLQNEKDLAGFSLTEEGIDPDSIPDLVQTLLGNPYGRLFRSLMEIQQENQENEED